MLARQNPYLNAVNFFLENIMLIHVTLFSEQHTERAFDKHGVDISLAEWLKTDEGKAHEPFLRDFSEQFKQHLLDCICTIDHCDEQQAVATYHELLLGKPGQVGLISLIRPTENYVTGSIITTINSVNQQFTNFFGKYDRNRTITSLLVANHTEFAQANSSFSQYRQKKFMSPPFSQSQSQTQPLFDSQDVLHAKGYTPDMDPLVVKQALINKARAAARMARYLAWLLDDEKKINPQLADHEYGPLSAAENLLKVKPVEIGVYDAPHHEAVGVIDPCVQLCFDRKLPNYANLLVTLDEVFKFINQRCQTLQAELRCQIERRDYREARESNETQLNRLRNTEAGLSPRATNPTQTRALNHDLEIIVITGTVEQLTLLKDILKAEYLEKFQQLQQSVQNREASPEDQRLLEGVDFLDLQTAPSAPPIVAEPPRRGIQRTHSLLFLPEEDERVPKRRREDNSQDEDGSESQSTSYGFSTS